MTAPDLAAPLIADVDVRIVGARSAGSSAAITAARNGASVLLIDRPPFLAAEVRDGRVEAIVVAARAACARASAHTIIDASGDADLCAFAGFGLEAASELDPAQALTTTFRMVNVDLERRRAVSRAFAFASMTAEGVT